MYGDYIPDPIEIGEARVDNWYFDNVKDGIATCCCGNKFKFEDGETISPDPYAIPVCPDCSQKWFDEQEAKQKEKNDGTS